MSGKENNEKSGVAKLHATSTTSFQICRTGVIDILIIITKSSYRLDNSDKEEEIAQKPVKIAKSKWEGEDEEEEVAVCVPHHIIITIADYLESHWASHSQSEWDDSSEDEKSEAAPPTNTAPPKKKRTLKQVLAEKEAEKAARIARGEYDEDELVEMHPQERAKLDKEKEMQADLNNATDLLGGVSVGSCACSSRIFHHLH